jgi:hypothetical protein
MGTRIARSNRELQGIIQELQAIKMRRPLAITITPWYPPPSKGQRVDYFKMVDEIAKVSGNDRASVHQDLKNKFLGVRLIRDGDDYKEVSQSTKPLNAKEFREYAEECRAWATVFFNLDGGNHERS